MHTQTVSTLRTNLEHWLHVRLAKTLRAREEAMGGGSRRQRRLGSAGRKVVRESPVGARKQAQILGASLCSGDLGLDTVPSPAVHTHALLLPQSPLFPRPSMSSDVVLPGQPIPLPRGPIPQIGSGIYSRDGGVRASLIGVPSYSGSVGLFALFLPVRL